MKNTEKYYLGLDIGTDSVGYAVTDNQYTLKKFHGEPAWGVTIFDAASQAAERRMYRVNRRRLDRAICCGSQAEHSKPDAVSVECRVPSGEPCHCSCRR